MAPNEAAWLPRSGALRYAIELFGIGLAYFVFAKVGLALASINPSATRSGRRPDWPWQH